VGYPLGEIDMKACCKKLKEQLRELKKVIVEQNKQIATLHTEAAILDADLDEFKFNTDGTFWD
jgi:hypothetical protein